MAEAAAELGGAARGGGPDCGGEMPWDEAERALVALGFERAAAGSREPRSGRWGLWWHPEGFLIAARSVVGGPRLPAGARARDALWPDMPYESGLEVVEALSLSYQAESDGDGAREPLAGLLGYQSWGALGDGSSLAVGTVELACGPLRSAKAAMERLRRARLRPVDRWESDAASLIMALGPDLIGEDGDSLHGLLSRLPPPLAGGLIPRGGLDSLAARACGRWNLLVREELARLGLKRAGVDAPLLRAWARAAGCSLAGGGLAFDPPRPWVALGGAVNILHLLAALELREGEAEPFAEWMGRMDRAELASLARMEDARGDVPAACALRICAEGVFLISRRWFDGALALFASGPAWGPDGALATAAIGALRRARLAGERQAAERVAGYLDAVADKAGGRFVCPPGSSAELRAELGEAARPWLAAFAEACEIARSAAPGGEGEASRGGRLSL